MLVVTDIIIEDESIDDGMTTISSFKGSETKTYTDLNAFVLDNLETLLADDRFLTAVIDKLTAGKKLPPDFRLDKFFMKEENAPYIYPIDKAHSMISPYNVDKFTVVLQQISIEALKELSPKTYNKITSIKKDMKKKELEREAKKKETAAKKKQRELQKAIELVKKAGIGVDDD